MEEQCKWYFEKSGGMTVGPTSPSKGTFPASPEINVVREAIQNSLDAQEGDDPVCVKFTFSQIKSADFPNLFYIREHIKATLEFFKKSNNKRAQEKYPAMIEYLSADGQIDELQYAPKIDILTISDYNTKGMKYIPGNDTCPFNAFLHSTGVSTDKSDDSGGSNGLGKETLFNLSKITTLLLTSRTDKGIVFQGAAKLATHFEPDSDNQETKLSAYGFYGLHDNLPVTDNNLIPEIFQRDEIGTDIRIVGIDLSNREETVWTIVKAVLNHFWMTIYRKKLIVEVDNKRIDHSNLENLILQCFGDTTETKTRKYDAWNPRSYYFAVVNAENAQDKSICEEEENPSLGHIKLYLDWHDNKLPKRVVFMREPLMSIYKKAYTSYPCFVGVFVCDNNVGNILLRNAEPPAHDIWEIANYEGNGIEKEKTRKALNECQSFVKRTLDKYLRKSTEQNEILIPGLAELLPDVPEKTNGGTPGTAGSGTSEGLYPSGDLSETETAGLLTEAMGELNVGEQQIQSDGQQDNSVNGLVKQSVIKKDDQNNSDEIIVARKPESTTGPNPHPNIHSGSGNSVEGGKTDNGDNAQTHLKLPVISRIACRRINEEIWYKIIISRDSRLSPEKYKSVQLFLRAGNDNGGDEDIDISCVRGLPSDASWHENSIDKISLLDNLSFDVKLLDNFMHTIRITAYAK